MTFKKYLAITIPIIVVILIAALAWANVGGIGSWLGGTLGPAGKGFYNIFAAPLKWAASGGWPTLAIFYLGAFSLVLAFGYVVWHYDLPYKITGAAASNAASGYDNTMKREPEEPERTPTTPAQPAEKTV